MHINPDNIRDMGSIGAMNQMRVDIEVDGQMHAGLSVEASLDLVRLRMLKPIFETKIEQDRRKRAVGMMLISVRSQLDRGCWGKWLGFTGLHQKTAWRWMKFADPAQVGINIDGTPRFRKGNGQEIGHQSPIAYPKTEQRSGGGVVAKLVGGMVAPVMAPVMAPVSDEPYCPPVDDVDHGDGEGGPGGGGGGDEDDDDAPPFDGGDDDDEDFIEDDEDEFEDDDDLPLEDEETDDGEQNRGGGAGAGVVILPGGEKTMAGPAMPRQAQLSLAGVYRSKAACRALEEIVDRALVDVSERDDELVAGWIGGTGERISEYLAHGRGQADRAVVLAK